MNYSVFNILIESPIRKMWNLATMNPLKQHLVAKYLYFCLINQLNASPNFQYMIYFAQWSTLLIKWSTRFLPTIKLDSPQTYFIYISSRAGYHMPVFIRFFWHILRFIFRNLLRILLNRFQISWTKPCSSETRSFDLNEPNLFLFQKTLVHAKNIH